MESKSSLWLKKFIKVKTKKKNIDIVDSKSSFYGKHSQKSGK